MAEHFSAIFRLAKIIQFGHIQRMVIYITAYSRNNCHGSYITSPTTINCHFSQAFPHSDQYHIIIIINYIMLTQTRICICFFPILVQPFWTWGCARSDFARHQQPLAAVLRFIVHHPKSRRRCHPSELRHPTGARAQGWLFITSSHLFFGPKRDRFQEDLTKIQ